ncbi:dicarboxylate transporter/tellurite-resistance protein TehA [Roseiterribacter gracilis]|uniref:Dicarboxylate transporter/tellurite-resistance protein TehA n=1 Tax=Roseiterribacter gracilis TaxID=2812848 RepID=A0A8S8XCB3_9PROT|nr:dicarboxylate transporter/tellurite-resistance protein TehA [Rhodospirillales bacterium TMPK1]
MFIPASFFGAVIGLAALGLGWRVAARVWHLPPLIAEAICGVAFVVWLLLLVLYARKWIVAREEAWAEIEHPVQCCFVALIFTASLLIAAVLVPYQMMAAKVVYWAFTPTSLLFAAWRFGGLWRGGRDNVTTTSALYLPLVGSPLVACGVGAGAFGWHDLGCVLFGMGVLPWLALESVILNRLLNAAPMIPPLRPTLGIQLAPPAVSCGAYLSLTSGVPDTVALLLFGYALLQALFLLRLSSWIAEGGVSMAFWGFSFGISALGADAARFADRGATGGWDWIAPLVFGLANVSILLLVLNSVRLLLAGRALPPPLLPR